MAHYARRANVCYDVIEMRKYASEMPLVKVGVDDIAKFFYLPVWRTSEGSPLSPTDLIESARHGVVLDADHLNRIVDADLNYPIFVRESDLLGIKYDPLDGWHRVARAKLSHLSEIDARVFDEKTLELTIIPDPDLIVSNVSTQSTQRQSIHPSSSITHTKDMLSKYVSKVSTMKWSSRPMDPQKEKLISMCLTHVHTIGRPISSRQRSKEQTMLELEGIQSVSVYKRPRDESHSSNKKRNTSLL